MGNAFFANLCRKAESHPDDACFELFGAAGHERTLTFAHMRTRIAQTAEYLRAQGVQSDAVVLIFSQHSEGKLLAFFGAQWMGAVPAFMPPPTIKQDVEAWAKSHRQLIERIRPHVVVSEPSCLEHVRALGVDVVVSTDDIENWNSAEAGGPIAVALDRVAFLQHSSGTTGLKKGVMVSYRQLLSQLDVYGASIGVDDDCNIVTWLPIYHDMGLIAATLMPMRFGIPVRLIDTFSWLSNPGMLMEMLGRYENAYCWLPNFAFNFLAKRTRVELAPNALAGVRAVINCSEPCKVHDMRAFETRFEPHGLPKGAVQVCYAAAEYVFAMTQTPPGEAIVSLEIDAAIFESEGRAVLASGDGAERTKVVVPVGLPIPGAEIRIGSYLPDAEVGEIIIRGPSMCNGYFRNEEMTTAKFVDGWYHTGDLGFKFGDSYYVTGRMDDLIIVRGKNVYAHDIEAIASAVPGVKDGRTTAFGVEDSSGTQQLVLAVEATGEVDARTLKIEISERVNVEFGMVPAEIIAVQLNTLVKTTSGKISRSENKNNYISKSLRVVS